MGEYVKHPLLIKEEVKLGVFRGESRVTSNYPKWVLQQFLTSGYEPKERIQAFLDVADKVEWNDYKQFGKSEKLLVKFAAHSAGAIEGLVEEMVAEGILLMLYGEPDNPETVRLITTTYAERELREAAKEYRLNYLTYPIIYPYEGVLDVSITDETANEENPGFNVEVSDTFNENGEGKGDRREDLSKRGFATLDTAEFYISELDRHNQVNRLDKPECIWVTYKTLSLAGFSGIQKLGPDNENLNDLILEAYLHELGYHNADLDIEEYPSKAWTVWISQNNYDRQKNQLSIKLLNEGTESGVDLSDAEKKTIVAYTKSHGWLAQAELHVDDATVLK